VHADVDTLGDELRKVCTDVNSAMVCIDPAAVSNVV
jgi:hypothetical protein